EMGPFINVAPRVGECAKDFTALGLDGKPIKLSDFKGKRIILETGSVTCPMFGDNIEGMNRVVKKFTDDNTVFLMLYVREAHPGGKLPAHQSQVDKISAAKSTAELSHPNRIFLVDDIAGAFINSGENFQIHYGLSMKKAGLAFVVTGMTGRCLRVFWKQTT
ncbi:MAG: deiodinase-like protein, partial [Psychromonas sp.]